jgi:phosphopantothenoylcysteine decarboxylase/phosphopantothenate--cysteine ligase
LLAPIRALITAGPTHEPIDSVRYIANRSSGRMGLALAQASIVRGWSTTLLLGPTPLQPPDHSHVRTIRFQTTTDLQQLLVELWPDHDLLIMAAAVADFRPTRTDGKVKRGAESVILKLEPTPDLLSGLARITRPDQTVIGFALETSDQLLDSAKDKLLTKQLDAIVANPLETMDADRVTATVLFRDGRSISAAPSLRKGEFADWLLSTLTPLLRSRQ